MSSPGLRRLTTLGVRLRRGGCCGDLLFNHVWIQGGRNVGAAAPDAKLTPESPAGALISDKPGRQNANPGVPPTCGGAFIA